MSKIRIKCTSLWDLSFNDKPINKTICKDIINALQPNNIKYIKSIIILYKEKILTQSYETKFTDKSFEIECKEQINKIQFEELIKKMQKIGFKTINIKNNIQLIDMTDHNIIYNYNFITCLPIPITYKTNNNKYDYSQQFFYKKL